MGIAMRVTTEGLINQALFALRTSLMRMSRGQDRMATGRRLGAAADDPDAAAAATRLRSRLAQAQRYDRQADAARAALDQNDGLLAGLNEVIARARELALRGAGGSQPDLSGVAAEVNQLLEDAVATANTETDGRRLLGGQEILTAPLTVTRDATGQITADTENPRGNNGKITLEIAAGITVQLNLPGEDVLGAAIDPTFLPTLLINLRNSLTANDAEAVRALIDPLRTAQDRLQPLIASVGGRLELVDRIQTGTTEEALTLQAALSELVDADLAQVTMELSRDELIYKAALAATARTIQPSLMEFLR
jgi:flagellar hook-associated protein 3 FlgL